VGKYGNADPLDASQWLAIKTAIPPISNRRWLESSSTCSGMITGPTNNQAIFSHPSIPLLSLFPLPPSLPPFPPLGLNYLLTYTETGEKKNPQKKLLIVEPQYTTSDIQMRSVQLP
jgi:hypothetical protein